MNFVESWEYLNQHHMFSYQDVDLQVRCGSFKKALDIDVAVVDPVTLRIEDEPERNTLPQVWLECGPYVRVYHMQMGSFMPSHDIDLDCGANTFEEAIIKLAELVQAKYGDNPA